MSPLAARPALIDQPGHAACTQRSRQPTPQKADFTSTDRNSGARAGTVLMVMMTVGGTGFEPV